MSEHNSKNKQVILAGWETFRKACIHPDASAAQVSEVQNAFYAGCTLLFSTIMNVLDPGEEITEKDLQVMSNIREEIMAWGQSFKQQGRH
ncbi:MULTISPECIES: hypothetical protein [unclassified Pseudomonas]|uniref:hypothetical protein n=1 Tax=unclassified Pseudomonas TaxID=196821 RepID=UPI001C60A62D|nr:MULTISPECIES: hypothetical protein [unclassified Pseudomonas]MBW5416078.1 hypothetical protein [Pseudomonas sp. MAG002Y]